MLSSATSTNSSAAPVEGAPAVLVDIQEKGQVGGSKNPGQEWRPKGHPEPVRVHDFLIPAPGKARPYGVYDLQRNEAG